MREPGGFATEQSSRSTAQNAKRSIMRRQIVIVATALSGLAGGSVASAADPAAVAVNDPHFVPLERITAPIFSTSRIEGSVDVTLVLQAADAGAAATMTRHMPELRAASLAATMEFARLYASGLTAVNAEQLSADLTTALKRTDPAIARVLIVKVAAQPA